MNENQNMTSLSLSELAAAIEETIRLNFDRPVWVRAEISELRENSNGHCYMELIEKDENSDNLLAKVKATCWASVYRLLKPYFENATGQTFRAGLKVLLSVTVEFHPVYGLSLTVRDIEPTFTIGEMAARRMQIIRRLEADGIADMNKQIPLPRLVQRLAVVSSPTAAGYGDFCDQLKNNSGNFVFYTRLFPALMQGEQAESSIIAALEKIFRHAELFDAVVIIRGGGATTDLSCFDSYELAVNCAQFPLPIITGIGHQRDVSILDLVAHSSLKTPTAVAEFLIDRLQEAENLVKYTASDIYSFSKNYLDASLREINEKKLLIRQVLRNSLMRKQNEINRRISRLKTAVRMKLLREQNRLTLMEKSIETHSPAFMLKYGYSFTTLHGKKIFSVHEVKPGDHVQTYLHDGSFESEVI
ncbi:MAG: Exodeoxyribonuclease 7 large subunit [Bacteroidetes bacterium ADurb.BinA395]|nr:MAG: Exodeoxyribonuclease 7 large subunit [Bacteroidetes bacterium ADurb.BinA395]HOF98999.1 exodeoxyribonuclease VII large subunit [Paludibacteraceae bacterium]HOR38937.1 exodeoxyribonuclease VII large subunit [Paludibacteraceae bacterium]HQG67154.1 exodeoxyribonuclease VII large subunit [Paludibacteraceae bacterium]